VAILPSVEHDWLKWLCAKYVTQRDNRLGCSVELGFGVWLTVHVTQTKTTNSLPALKPYMSG